MDGRPGHRRGVVVRCTCCGRSINPANAYKAQGGTFGPICAVRLGLTKPAPKLKRKPSRFAIFTTVVKQDDFQPDFFGVAA